MRSHIVFQTPWFQVEEIDANQPANPLDGAFYRIVTGDGAICVVLSDDDRFVMVRQFRPALQMVTLEFPAGGIDDGETPEQAAAREVKEETGHVCQRFLNLGPGHLHLNRFLNTEYFFFGVGATPQPGWRPEAGVDLVLVPRTEFRALVAAGEFRQTAALAIVPMLEISHGVRLLSDSFEDLMSRLAAGTAPHPVLAMS